MVIDRKSLPVLIAILLLGVFFAVTSVLADPFGATTTAGNPNRSVADAAGSVNAYAGNITPVTITGYSITGAWQGYYGNVSGTIQLADSSDNVLYNWTLASPRGEVFASMNQSITWTQLYCFNFTANDTYGAAQTPGGIALSGLNLSEVENQFNISVTDVDGLNETFNASRGHDTFFVGALRFDADECLSTRLFSSTGQIANQFEEVLLYENSTYSVIYTSLLEQDVSGFDSVTHDFEMLVLENGHGTDTTATTYYFFVELE